MRERVNGWACVNAVSNETIRRYNRNRRRVSFQAATAALLSDAVDLVNHTANYECRLCVSEGNAIQLPKLTRQRANHLHVVVAFYLDAEANLRSVCR